MEVEIWRKKIAAGDSSHLGIVGENYAGCEVRFKTGKGGLLAAMNDAIWSRILKFNDKWFPNWRTTEPIYYSNALAGETGEVCDAIKHMIGGGTRKVDEKTAMFDAAKEAVDVTIYLVLLLERIGCHGFEEFERVFDIKMKENESRMLERNSH
jgi:NTP pyrophosphatase (non-canonical NTP hydrolase)